MPKVILISRVPLPFSQIGSWTTLYKNYLTRDNQIDFIVCNKPESKFDGVEYSFVENDFSAKIMRKWGKNPYYGYLKALEKIFDKNEKYIIQIVDNFGIVKVLADFLEKKSLRKQCYLQFFYHGFPPFYGNFESRSFFETIDEMVVLTFDSYLAHKQQYTVLPTRFSVLHNGIDTAKFHPVSTIEKEKLKKEKDFSGKKVFLWCSQDRPKKGLHIVLDAWKRVYKTRQDIALLVIGCEPKSPIEGVHYLGRMPNDELPKYYQTADCYLFSTLCHEGFGMNLIEALHCGNYCIASSIGGVPEVLQYGKLGKLIEEPNFVGKWENAILEYIENPVEINVDPKLYSSEAWNSGMNNVINNAKQFFF